MYILGINLNHADSSCAIFKNGKLLCATEEERFKRIKHWAGLPIDSIQFCLDFVGIKISDVNGICIGRDPKAKLFQKAIYSIQNINTLFSSILPKLRNFQNLNKIEKQINNNFGYCPKIHFIEHHRSHLASSYYSSPYDSAALVSIDGAGDFSTIMIGKAKGNNLQVLKSQDYPISLGLLYTAFTQYLGFPYYGDEYKVMGLAPYGDSSKYIDKLRKIIWVSNDSNKILDWDSEYFNFKNGVVDYINNIPKVETIYSESKFKKEFGIKRSIGDSIDQSHKDLAASLQLVVEELIFEILEIAHKMTSESNVCISGGVAQNSVANGKILKNTSFQNLYVPSAGHDAGIAMGSAQYYLHNIKDIPRENPIFNASLGIKFQNKQIEEILLKRKLNYKFLKDKELFPYLAQALVNEKVIGFFNGRAEFGPRALGNRSILADPRNKNAQQLLNEKIKKRESFRPFAPSILEEYGEEFFENYQNTPFMERVLPIKKEKRALIPAVTHVDGSGRLQSVSKETSPRYYSLIEEFFKLTGIPILINTSFNENEPVVNSPIEAIKTFERTDLDILVLENFLLEKTNKA